MPDFVLNAEAVARKAMKSVQPALAEKYMKVIRFLALDPSCASKAKGKNAPTVGSAEYIIGQAAGFAAGRNPKAPEKPATVPDEMVSYILHHYFEVPEDQLDRIKNEHLISMGAENMVGNLLERYIATVLEPLGWVWCSGSMVKAVDFVKPPASKDDQWTLLQVKNRDNSENSSSSAIRDGTAIIKWFRTFSKKPGSNWPAFPDSKARGRLSEDAFKEFAKNYLQSLKA